MVRAREEVPAMNPSVWSACPKTVPFPGQDEVHLWRVQLSEENEQDLRAILTSDEIQRADRFHFAADRRRYTVTRALLRTILGEYLRAAPESLCFQYNEFGKPFLARSQNPRGINFNVAHSGDCSLLAFGLATHLGVDVEHLEVERNVVDLARTVFSPSQYGSFLALSDVARKRAFFEAWTRKEAVVKALGCGLSIPLHRIEVEIASAPEWSVRNIDVGDHYAAAVAVRALSIDLRLWGRTITSGTASAPA
jgi:4'-phosphopantetheinyl transferase